MSVPDAALRFAEFVIVLSWEIGVNERVISGGAATEEESFKYIDSGALLVIYSLWGLATCLEDDIILELTIDKI